MGTVICCFVLWETVEYKICVVATVQKSCGSGSVEEINNFTHTSLLIFYKEKEFFAYYGIYIIYMFIYQMCLYFFFY